MKATESNIVDIVNIINESVKKYSGSLSYLATGGLKDSMTLEYEFVEFSNKPSRADLTVKKGDVITARMKETKKVLEITEETQNIIVSTGFLVLRPTQQINSRYLYHYLKSNYFQFSKDNLCT
ncbi:MAG: hypothetical protein KAX05_09305 [Bacteroidales bacterium]|nr:hypothetical protein [Bacteroidales bacterium]